MTGHRNAIYHSEFLEKTPFTLEIGSIPADFKILAKEISVKYRRGCYKIQLRKKKQPSNELVVVSYKQRDVH